MITLDSLPHAQKERLAFIDFSLQYFGEASRASLVQRFKTGLAACTRDFAVYKQLAADNLTLDQRTKTYHRSRDFQPLFAHDAEQILHGLCHGFGDGLSNQYAINQVCFDAIRLIHPDADVIATLMRAIYQRKVIEGDYVSLSSGRKQRQMVPHAIINNGHRWHVRAFCRESDAFRDFVCTRFTSVSVIDDAVTRQEHREYDDEWHQLVPLVLVPHPKLTHPEAVMLDYGMEDGALRLSVRAAVAGYLLRQWHVDCSDGAVLDDHACHLALENRQVLANITQNALLTGLGGSLG